MNHLLLRVGVALGALAFLAAPAGAQTGEVAGEPADTARLHWGPLAFTPTLTIGDVGVDTNVFNESEEHDPKRDVTTTLRPVVDYWLRLGRGRLAGKTAISYMFFKDFDNQRSLNGEQELRLELPINRLTPFVDGKYANTRERPGFEIDSRARRKEQLARVGIEAGLGKTKFVLSAGRGAIKYDRGQVFLGTDLSAALDRDTEAAALQVRYALTPLTTFVVEAEGRRDRFDFATIKDADTYSIKPGFEFKPFALIEGKAFVGVREFRTLNGAVPDFTGVVASVELAYALTSTRFGVRVDRDVKYSFGALQPFYVATDVGVSVTQRITRSWDVVAQTQRAVLDYHALPASGTRGRRDTVLGYRGGIGYWVGQTLRIGLNVDHYTRRSKVVVSRTYEGLRVGASISYGLSP